MNVRNGSLNGNHNGNGVHETEEIEMLDLLGDAHQGNPLATPMREGAFDLSDEEKMEQIADHFREILDILGMDLNDDSIKGTPRRVAKMYVQEIFKGLNPEKKPKATLFDNKYQYRNILLERDIRVQSFCEHHFLPIYGKAHVAYISSGKVIGLSKLNRIVDYYSRRPQVQERLTMQIANELKEVLGTEDVAVIIDAKHMCVQARGIEHQCSSTVTAEYGGRFLNENVRQELLQMIGYNK
jgi:GTP cyclohydrolase I